MGTDWVRLFDKRLCDEIVALDSFALTFFPHVQEKQFLLLRPEHVDQMIRPLADRSMRIAAKLR